MDASALIGPLIGLMAPITISAFKWRAGRIETRKARLDYWKTYFEVAPLAGHTVGDETKQLCIAELAEGEDETRNLDNKLVSFITNASTVTLMYIVSFIFGMYSGFMEQLRVEQYAQYQRQQHAVVITPEQFQSANEQLGYLSLALQVVVMCLIWFWLRWRIRDYVWGKFRPGRSFHSLLNAGERVQAFVKFVLLSLVFAVVWICTVYAGSILKLVFLATTGRST